MDPDACLAEIRSITANADNVLASVPDDYPLSDIAEAFNRLVDLADAIDHWMSAGGFLPGPWER